MLLRERFIFDPQENILFINLAALRIESREQVDDICRVTAETLQQHGGRAYSIVNYEGTEIAAEVVDYYGERIKELYDRYSLTTVRYSSSGYTRSMLRYLGAAIDLESNIFATRDEAIRAIQELKDRSRTSRKLSASLQTYVCTPGASSTCQGGSLVKRITWLNPLLRYDKFEAAAAGIRAMMPFVDEFRPVHSLDSLADLAESLVKAVNLEHDPRKWMEAS